MHAAGQQPPPDSGWSILAVIGTVAAALGVFARAIRSWRPRVLEQKRPLSVSEVYGMISEVVDRERIDREIAVQAAHADCAERDHRLDRLQVSFAAVSQQLEDSGREFRSFRSEILDRLDKMESRKRKR